jgi:hypothetical protein
VIPQTCISRSTNVSHVQIARRLLPILESARYTERRELLICHGIVRIGGTRVSPTIAYVYSILLIPMGSRTAPVLRTYYTLWKYFFLPAQGKPPLIQHGYNVPCHEPREGVVMLCRGAQTGTVSALPCPRLELSSTLNDPQFKAWTQRELSYRSLQGYV